MGAPVKHATSMVLIKTAEIPARILLLEHRKHERWLPPGGHQEAWENIFECALREAKEETGIDVAQYLPGVQEVDEFSRIIPSPSRIVEVAIPQRGDEPAHFHLDHTYVATVPKPIDIVKDDVETNEFGWFTLEETKNMEVPEDIRLVLEQEMQS